MLLSSNMIRLHDVFGINETLDIFARVGIQGIDFNNDVGEYHTNEHDRQFYAELSEYAAQRGITVCQAHAPFPSSYIEKEKTQKRFEDIVLGMRNASYLGAPMIVVHPCNHQDISVESNCKIMLEYNIDFYKRLIPYARKFGIKIAIENIKGSVSERPEGLIELYDSLNDPIFTLCFDVGHCLICGVDPAEAIRKLGDRLRCGCTHIHDNFGNGDSHTLPFYGSVDWESVMKALADIGYCGDLNYEASGFIKDIPTELRPDGLAYMAKVGHYLIGRFEYYKNGK